MRARSIDPAGFFGVAGPQPTDQDKALVKQALFLMRYRARILRAVALSE